MSIVYCKAEIYYVGDFQNPAATGRRELRRNLNAKHARDYRRQDVQTAGTGYTVTKKSVNYKSQCVENEKNTQFGFKVSAKFLPSDVPTKDQGAKYAVDSRYHITRDLGLNWKDLELHKIDTCDDNNKCDQIFPRTQASTSGNKKTKVHYYLDFKSLAHYKKFEDQMPSLSVFKGAELEQVESVSCNDNLSKVFEEARKVATEVDDSSVWSLSIMTIIVIVALLF